jgi:hypothetical protein
MGASQSLRVHSLKAMALKKTRTASEKVLLLRQQNFSGIRITFHPYLHNTKNNLLQFTRM